MYTNLPKACFRPNLLEMTKSFNSDLELCECTSHEEIEELAKFTTLIHDEEAGDMTRGFGVNHPNAERMHWLVHREKKSGDIVSTIALLPWIFEYEGVKLPAAELGIVGTRKDWRNKGLNRELMRWFVALIEKNKYLVSHIQGIPYFYRQYGYDYAIPLETQHYLEFRHIAKLNEKKDPSKVSLRAAKKADINAIQKWYNKHTQRYGICTNRSEEVWRYIIASSLKTEGPPVIYIIRYKGENVGYCRIPLEGFGDALILGECSELPPELYPSFFEQLEKIAVSRDKPFIRLNIGTTHPCTVAALAAGARDAGSYAWQIRLPDPVKFLGAIRRVLNRRIRNSSYTGISKEIRINCYRFCIHISIDQGKIISINDSNGRADMSIPPNLLAPLMFGQKSFDEFKSLYPDLSGGVIEVDLFKTLFPAMDGFLYPPY